MKALVLKEYCKFTYEDVPDPVISHIEVLVRVKACAVCGSDVHGMDGSTGRRIPPIIMGHEASGVIEDVGADVKGFFKGDRVTFDSTIYCGECYYCRYGKTNLCDKRRVLGVSCGEYRQNGALAEYIALPQHILHRLPDIVSFEHAAMVEPLSIAMHAVNNTGIAVNDSAVVVGAGMIGNFIIQLLRLSGCRKVIAVDIDRDKLELAGKGGAHAGLKAEILNFREEILKLTKNRGADIAFEVVGITSALKTAVDSLKKGGLLTLVGNLSPLVEFPLQTIVTKEIKVNGSCTSAGEYEACLDMIADRSVNVDLLISKVAPLAEGALWFNHLYDKKAGLMKVILIP